MHNRQKDEVAPPKTMQVGMIVAFLGGAVMVVAGTYTSASFPALSRVAIIVGMALEVAFIGLQVYWQVKKRSMIRA